MNWTIVVIPQIQAWAVQVCHTCRLIPTSTILSRPSCKWWLLTWVNPKKLYIDSAPALSTELQNQENFTQIDTTYKKIQSWHSQNPLKIWRVWCIVRALGVSFLPDLLSLFPQVQFFCKSMIPFQVFRATYLRVAGFFVPSLLQDPI